MYYRFVLNYDGEDDVGFLSGISEIEYNDWDEVEMVLSIFEEHLLLPPYNNLSEEQRLYAKCYFTEKGYQFFYDAIERLISYYEQYSCYDIRKIEVETFDEILYNDEYQVLVKERI